MKASIVDREQLQNLAPIDISSYLQAKGWQRDESGYARAVLWTIGAENGKSHEVLMPTETSVRDFALRVAELLRTLAEVEQRSPFEIIRDILYARSDVIRLRRPEEGNTMGGIPLVDGDKLIGEAITLMTAAAGAAISPGKVLSARQAAQTREYLQHVKMGQTERGSFVLTSLISGLTCGPHTKGL